MVDVRLVLFRLAFYPVTAVDVMKESGSTEGITVEHLR